MTRVEKTGGKGGSGNRKKKKNEKKTKKKNVSPIQVWCEIQRFPHHIPDTHQLRSHVHAHALKARTKMYKYTACTHILVCVCVYIYIYIYIYIYMYVYTQRHENPAYRVLFSYRPEVLWGTVTSTQYITVYTGFSYPAQTTTTFSSILQVQTFLSS